jgi:hypothetical protein
LGFTSFVLTLGLMTSWTGMHFPILAHIFIHSPVLQHQVVLRVLGIIEISWNISRGSRLALVVNLKSIQPARHRGAAGFLLVKMGISSNAFFDRSHAS